MKINYCSFSIFLFYHRELEKMAIDVLRRCYKVDPVLTEDLLIREIDLFAKHTVLELALEANSFEFMAQNSVQTLLSHIWYGKIETDVPYIKVNENDLLHN